GLWIEGGGESGNNANIRLKENIPVQSSTDYTLQDDSTYVSAINTIYVHEYTVNGTWLRSHNISRGGETTFRTHWNTTNIRITYLAMSGFTIHTGYVEHIDGRIKVKLEEGSSATPFMNALSRVEQLADKVSIAVAEIDGSYVTQSELSVVSDGIDAVSSRISDVEDNYVEQSSVIVRPEYAQIGSMRIDGDTVGSLLRVSPSGIDAVAEAMRLSGDLFVKGDVQAYAMEAIEGNFARLWADEFSAITIDVSDISGLTARFEYLYTLSANIERLVSQKVFADGVTALVGNFVDVNAGNIVTSGLSANIIESSHIKSSNAMINKLFSNSARIDTLISKTHFVNEIKATSIDAVYANISDLRTKLLTANVITSNHIKVENALIDKMFASTALIERLTSKSAFIRDIQAIEITANQLNLTTLTNRINQIEGGLRIRRPDGVDWVRNGQARGHVPVQVHDSYSDDRVSFTGLNFTTGSSSWQTCKHFYTPHEGTLLRIVWAVGLYAGPSVAEYMDVRIRTFSAYRPAGTQTRSAYVLSGGGPTYITQEISMPPPTYREM